MNIVPDIGTLFEYNNSKYRLTGWMKPASTPKFNDHIDRILYESCQQINGKRWQWCERNNATHVCGVGVSGCMAPINEIKVIGKANIPNDVLNSEKDLASRLIGEMLF